MRIEGVGFLGQPKVDLQQPSRAVGKLNNNPLPRISKIPHKKPHILGGIMNARGWGG